MAREYLVRNDLGDNPALANELGHLNVAWAAMELRIFYLFEVLTGLPVPVARAIYYSLRTTRARIELVQAVAPIVLRRRRALPGRPPWELGQPLADLKKVSRLLGSIGRMSGERNRLVHDPWIGFETNTRAHQMRLSGKELMGRFEPVRAREIRALSLRIETKISALHRLYDALAPKVLPLLDKLQSHHEIFLESGKKGSPPKKKKAKR